MIWEMIFSLILSLVIAVIFLGTFIRDLTRTQRQLVMAVASPEYRKFLRERFSSALRAKGDRDLVDVNDLACRIVDEGF